MGTKFSEGGFVITNLLQAGAILILKKEPDNKYDPNAIKVMAFDGTEHIGYVPNKGLSCSKCWSHVSATDNFCPGCSADFSCIVKGGLATRLIMTKSLDNRFVCFAKEVDHLDEFSPIKARLILE